jgi:hypothetical protein
LNNFHHSLKVALNLFYYKKLNNKFKIFRTFSIIKEGKKRFAIITDLALFKFRSASDDSPMWSFAIKAIKKVKMYKSDKKSITIYINSDINDKCKLDTNMSSIKTMNEYTFQFIFDNDIEEFVFYLRKAFIDLTTNYLQISF